MWLSLEDHYNICHHHVATHKCSYNGCYKAFGNRDTLKVHERLHVYQDKVLKCTFSVSCTYSTLSAKQMELHMSNCRKEKQFRCIVHKECELANKTFRKHIDLQQHKVSHMVDEGTRDHIHCMECAKQMEWQEKQFRCIVHKECELANKTFRKHVDLQQHKVSHMVDEETSDHIHCMECNKGFKTE